MTVGERIKRRRDELGISQEQLAEILGYKSKTSIHKVEQGITDLPLSKVKMFAEALKTTPAYIMGWTPEEEKINLLSKRERLQLDELMSQNAMYFNDENISEEDKEKLFASLQDAFFTVKLLNKRKK